MLKTLSYRKEVDINGVIRYYYHKNLIAIVNTNSQLIILDDCGWGGYRSTTRALNDVIRMYPGYKVIRK